MRRDGTGRALFFRQGFGCEAGVPGRNRYDDDGEEEISARSSIYLNCKSLVVDILLCICGASY